MIEVHGLAPAPLEDWQAQPEKHDPFHEWTCVDTFHPEVGQWYNVLCDEQMEGHWYALDFHPFKKRPRFSVQCARVRCINQWGGVEWERWSRPSGYALGELNTVTHYQLLPKVPEGLDDDTPLPKWTQND